MPLPKPRKGEKQPAFMARCMHEAYGSDAPESRTQEQAVAMCMDTWREAHGGKKPPAKGAAEVARIIALWTKMIEKKVDVPEPEDDETRDQFMDRCNDELSDDMDEDEADEACAMAWEDANGEDDEESKRWVRHLKKDDNDDGKKPYGDVEYADPGYQSDGKARYPIDTEDHIRAAWNYINKPENQKPYTSDQVSKIKGKIVAAWKKKIDPDGPPSADEKRAAGLVHKMHEKTAGEDARLEDTEYILSDATPDRFGDIVEPLGWEFKAFARNPICLFNHDSNFPIGTWRDLSKDHAALRGFLKLAPAGTSPRHDEIRKLVDAGILRAVSVGFKAIKSKPRNPPKDKDNPFDVMFGPKIYTQSELVECSLVAIPANPNSLAIAKSLHISEATQRLVFAEHGSERTRDASSRTRSGEHADEDVRRSATGEHARTHGKYGATIMLLSERIGEAQKEYVALCDELQKHLDKMDNSNVSDADVETSRDLNSRIVAKKRHLEALQESERNLAEHTREDGSGHRQLAIARPKPNGGGAPADVTAPYVSKGKTKAADDPIAMLCRAGATLVASKIWSRPVEETIARNYQGDEVLRIFSDIVVRAASAPAMTTVTGWAAELAHQIYADLMPLLMPGAIFTNLSGKGLTLTFGRAARINIPTRSRTPTLAGSFVGEGLAIPVRQGQFTTQALVPKKLGVISVWTREMDEHSIPAIEGLIREAIQQDTSVAIDTVLIDANPATAIRPAGLLNGVTVTTATAGGGLPALLGDLKALIGALATNTYGNIRTPVWLMNPVQVLNASLTAALNTGIFPFKDEIARGTLNTIPFIQSSTVPSGTVILVDAADFVSVGGDGPRLEMSDQATLHMEDTAPTDLVSGSPGVVASPQRSLWQTDSLALRLVLPLNWLQRRAGTVVYTTAVTW